MGGTAVRINIGAIRCIIDHICLCLKSIKNTFCNGRRTAVCTVQTYPYILEITAWDRDQITDIAVTSGCKIHSPPNICAGCQRKLLDLSVQICLDPGFDLCFDLLSITV